MEARLDWSLDGGSITLSYPNSESQHSYTQFFPPPAIQQAPRQMEPVTPIKRAYFQAQFDPHHPDCSAEAVRPHLRLRGAAFTPSAPTSELRAQLIAHCIAHPEPFYASNWLLFMPQRPKTPWKLVEVPGGPNDQAAVKAKLEQLCCGDSRDPKTACEAIYAENMEQEVLPGAGLESAAVGDLYTAWNVYFDAELQLQRGSI